MVRTIQIRDVDDETYAVLRSRAASEGLSLAAYLRRQLEEMTRGDTMTDLLARADRRRARGAGVSRDTIVTALRETRDEREQQL